MRLFRWLKAWWVTLTLDPEIRAALKQPHQPEDFVEAPRPE